MHNINPALIHGLALQWAEKKQPEELRYPVQRNHLDVRVYDLTGDGFFFIAGHGPGKWYRRDDSMDDHYCNTQISDVQRAIDAGGRVQIVGDRGKSFGVWDNWGRFEDEVLK